MYIVVRDTSIPNTFMQAISAHGGLVHVVLMARHVSEDGITTLIGNSPNLIALHICAQCGVNSVMLVLIKGIS